MLEASPGDHVRLTCAYGVARVSIGSEVAAKRWLGRRSVGGSHGAQTAPARAKLRMNATEIVHISAIWGREPQVALYDLLAAAL